MKKQLSQLVNYVNGFSELSSSEKVILLKRALIIFKEYKSLHEQERDYIIK